MLSPPVGGKVNVTGQYLGRKAIYPCKRGYVLVGFYIQLYIDNGTWSGETPICKCELLMSKAKPPQFAKIYTSG